MSAGNCGDPCGVIRMQGYRECPMGAQPELLAIINSGFLRRQPVIGQMAKANNAYCPTCGCVSFKVRPVQQ